MATPIIHAVTVTYPDGASSLAPGQTATIDIEATDADNTTLDIDLTATDGAGNKRQATAQIVMADALTFAATVDAEGAEVVRDPRVPSRFYVTVS